MNFKLYSQKYVNLIREMHERELLAYKAIICLKDENIKKLEKDIEYLRSAFPILGSSAVKEDLSFVSLFEEEKDVNDFLRGKKVESEKINVE